MPKETTEISREDVEQMVQMTEYFLIPNTTITLASLHLASGFVVTGESSVVNPVNFDQQRGREIARDKAIRKLTELAAFLQAEKRYEQAVRDVAGIPINLAQANQLQQYLQLSSSIGGDESASIARIDGRTVVFQDEGEPTELDPSFIA